MNKEKIEFSDWEKIELKIGRIENVEDIEGADKLYKLKINLGKETRTICAGLKQYYSKERLIRKNCVVLVNIKPRKIKGTESQWMILASVAENHEKVVLISPEENIPIGSFVS